MFDASAEAAASSLNAGVDTATRWGTIAAVESESDSDEEMGESDEEVEESDNEDELETDAAAYAEEGAAAGPGVPGAETPIALGEGESVDLRKGIRAGTETPDLAGHEAAALYKVLEESKATVGGEFLFSFIYRSFHANPANDFDLPPLKYFL